MTVATKRRGVSEFAVNNAPSFRQGRWYQFAAPGGFLLFGAHIKEMGLGAHRFALTRHLRNAGDVELPQMCRTGFGPQTETTKATWRHWNGTPLWWAPMEEPPTGDRLEQKTIETLDEEPAYIPGQWYQFASPGGFLLFGVHIKTLGMGVQRFGLTRHLRHAGQVELPQMCRTGFGPQTKTTNHSWACWNGTPLWWAPMEKCPFQDEEVTEELLEELQEEPDWIPGEWYQLAAPGGFTLFGQYHCPLGLGVHRLSDVKHLRNAGNIELPQMCREGFGPQTQTTKATWPELNVTPLWWARMVKRPW